MRSPIPLEVVRAGPEIEAPPPSVAKLCGADVELGNFIEGLRRSGGTGPDASRLLLAEIDGVSSGRSRYLPSCSCDDCRSRRRHTYEWAGRAVYDPQDWGRKFLATNGGCFYIDLSHLELCLPEVLGAHDWVTAWHAMLRIARRALRDANERLPSDQRLHAIANNSDGKGNSYGSHLSFLITQRARENIFERRCQYMLFLASYQISSILFTGQGKVGSENGAPPVDFQISQRADFFERLVGVQTTFDRPIVNSRHEALCGGARSDVEDRLARLHVIFYDSVLSQVSCLLKIGVMQIVLAMIEAERIDASVVLDDPLTALRSWSHDPALFRTAALLDGRRVTAVEHQLLFLEQARRFVDAGRSDGLVPRAREIVELWGDTLEKLGAQDFGALAGRLDWVLKKSVLDRLLAQRPELEWRDFELKHLDLMFSSLDPELGLFWAYGDVTETVVADEAIERRTVDPPEDTRAWARAMVLREAGPARIDEVNWDVVKLRIGHGGWAEHRRVDLADPLGSTRAEAGPVLEPGAETSGRARTCPEPTEEDDARLEHVVETLREISTLRAMSAPEDSTPEESAPVEGARERSTDDD